MAAIIYIVFGVVFISENLIPEVVCQPTTMLEYCDRTDNTDFSSDCTIDLFSRLQEIQRKLGFLEQTTSAYNTVAKNMEAINATINAALNGALKTTGADGNVSFLEEIISNATSPVNSAISWLTETLEAMERRVNQLSDRVDESPRHFVQKTEFKNLSNMHSNGIASHLTHFIDEMNSTSTKEIGKLANELQYVNQSLSNLKLTMGKRFNESNLKAYDIGSALLNVSKVASDANKTASELSNSLTSEMLEIEGQFASALKAQNESFIVFQNVTNINVQTVLRNMESLENAYSKSVEQLQIVTSQNISDLKYQNEERISQMMEEQQNLTGRLDVLNATLAHAVNEQMLSTETHNNATRKYLDQMIQNFHKHLDNDTAKKMEHLLNYQNQSRLYVDSNLHKLRGYMESFKNETESKFENLKISIKQFEDTTKDTFVITREENTNLSKVIFNRINIMTNTLRSSQRSIELKHDDFESFVLRNVNKTDEVLGRVKINMNITKSKVETIEQRLENITSENNQTYRVAETSIQEGIKCLSQLHQTRSELYDVRQELYATQNRLSDVQRDLNGSATKLTLTQSELFEMQKQLNETQEVLYEMQRTHNETLSSLMANNISLIQTQDNLRVLMDRVATLEGSSSTDTSTTIACNSVLVQRGRKGSFGSPNRPFVYSANSDCKWKIVVPGTNVVKVTVPHYAMEPHSSCTYDSLKFYDGPAVSNSQLGSSVCGTGSNWQATSSANVVLARFVSDSSVHLDGFSVIWEAVPRAGCSNRRIYAEENSNGTLQSPNYPSNYPNTARCSWTLYAPTRKRFQISVDRISTELCCDHLKMYAGPNANSPLIRTLNGSPGTPVTVDINAETVTITFTSDGSVTRQGFHLLWKVI